MGLRHHDRWLSDWIAAPHTALSQQADEHLSASVRAATGGVAEPSLSEAQQALALYTKAGNVPGRLRAEYAETYAYQRLGRDEECLTTAKFLERDPGIVRDSLLHARAFLDHSICTERGGNFAEAQGASSQVVELTQISGLSQLHLYAISMRATLLHDSGRLSAAWQVDEMCIRDSV